MQTALTKKESIKMKTIKDVVEMMEQGSRMTIEMMAYIYILNKHRKIAYTHDEFDEDDVYFIIDFNENVLLLLCDETSSYNITQDIAEALQI